MRILVVYDNVARPPLREGWGFSAFAEIGGRRLLFDAGADRLTLAHNARLLGLDFSSLTDIFISHPHCDHVGGLSEVMKAVGAPLSLILGGFHLEGASPRRLGNIA
ncbi:MAG: MBL fold metallo-hydrolase, partial [Candidatus Bipolaricaulaceae bacterium]